MADEIAGLTEAEAEALWQELDHLALSELGDPLTTYWPDISATVEQIIRERMAQAWDEAHLSLCRHHGLFSFTACRNPYRQDNPPGQQGGTE